VAEQVLAIFERHTGGTQASAEDVREIEDAHALATKFLL
jgi:hypothetical protein